MTRLSQSSSLNLPEPDRDAVEHSERLLERIGAEISAAKGWLSFERYMDIALYEPGLGYYSAGQTRFGAAGDFVTAPLVSSLFSRTLALQCAECLQALGGGVIFELGAGSGRMALDVLRELERRDQLPERYLILEVSATLRHAQQELFAAEAPHLLDRVVWLERLPDEPLQGVLLANEVIDALPVQRFRRTEQGVEELGVSWERGRLQSSSVAADARLTQAVAHIEQDLGRRLAAGYTSEYCPRQEPWLEAVTAVLERGVALLIDYGYPRGEYYHEQRDMGTLVCHYRHRGHSDPLILPGLQDITAFVDFTATAEAALAVGLDCLGYAPQAQFLLGAGLPELLADEQAGADHVTQLRLAQETKLLTLPGEMGERFKVLAVGRDFDRPLRGFALADHRDRL